jgi:hypothetical protein
MATQRLFICSLFICSTIVDIELIWIQHVLNKNFEFMYIDRLWFPFFFENRACGLIADKRQTFFVHTECHIWKKLLQPYLFSGLCTRQFNKRSLRWWLHNQCLLLLNCEGRHFPTTIYFLPEIDFSSKRVPKWTSLYPFKLEDWLLLCKNPQRLVTCRN